MFLEAHPDHLPLVLPRFHAPPGTNSSQAYHTPLAVHPLHTVMHPRAHNMLSASESLHPPANRIHDEPDMPGTGRKRSRQARILPLQ